MSVRGDGGPVADEQAEAGGVGLVHEDGGQHGGEHYHRPDHVEGEAQPPRPALQHHAGHGVGVNLEHHHVDHHHLQHPPPGHLVAELGDELRLDPEGADGDEAGEGVGEVREDRGAAQTLQPLQLPRGASGDTTWGQKSQKSAKRTPGWHKDPIWAVLPVEVLNVPVDSHHGHQADQQDGTLRHRVSSVGFIIIDNGRSQMRN